VVKRDRPDPDALLRRVTAGESPSLRGRLKIFFGASAGVGKTYTMLEAARARTAEGVDVAVGWVETHGRKDTAALVHGLGMLPPRSLEYRGTVLKEFDIDGALSRRPRLLLLDELAHSNAPGSRHAKRWQDVNELLDAGINVYTTLNVQHVESLNDLVAQITGVPVRETVPDSVLDRADEIELVDIPVDELLSRLKEGKVYIPEQARQASRNFFRRGNLIALRELALRRTAEHVDADMRDYRQEHAIERTWPVAERILVAVGPNPASARLIRAARRMSAGLRAEWWAVYVEAPAHVQLPQADKNALAENMKLADRLGARTAVLSGEDVSAEILAFAREHNVSKIVAGKPTHPRWRDHVYGSLVDEVARGSGEIDVYIISGDPGEGAPPLRMLPQARSRPSGYVLATMVVLGCTLICAAMFRHFELTNLVMVYLLGVAFVAARLGRGPSVLASCLGVATFDFFFVPPYLTFAVSDGQYVITFAVMLAVGLLISRLASRLRDQAQHVRQRERRTQIVYAMTRDLASLNVPAEIAKAARRHVADVFGGDAVVLLADGSGRLAPAAGAEEESRDKAVAEWAFTHQQRAGRGTDTLPGAEAVYLPLPGTRGIVGVLGLRLAAPGSLSPEQMDLLDTLARQVAVSLERAYLGQQAEAAQLEMDRERLRNTLLSSVSHDLRTPLAAVTGAASSLLEDVQLPESARRDLTETIYEESERLNRLVGNLLDMTRLHSGAVRVSKEWQSLEEIIGSAIRRTHKPLKDHVVRTAVAEDLPLVPVDATLLEQVLVNLLENAAKYTPARSTITLSARREGDVATVEVADEGPGLRVDELEHLFDSFYRGTAGTTAARPGVGLGLAICQAIIAAHGGRIWADNRKPSGAVFRFTLPLEGTPPPLADDVRSSDDER
jgi:two-component system sensor histidine kinase KdpD